LKEDTVTYKKLIAGVLVTLQKQVFEYLELRQTTVCGQEQEKGLAIFGRPDEIRQRI
jgi:hypothetical protein